MQKITPFLWFDNNAEEAMSFYAELFPDSKIGEISRYNEDSAQATGQKAGSMMTAPFTLCGMDFIALNGGPLYKFTEAVSFMVSCEDQAEVDKYWNTLTADGGEESNCGWLKDKYGLSWQIIPKQLYECVTNPDPVKAGKAMQAMLQMNKIIVADLEAAVK